MTGPEKFLLTLAATLLGSGLGTTIVGALFKRRFDAQLETHKAQLQRNSRIHERQVDTLLAIHCKLEQALFYLQRAASTLKLEREAPPQELLQRMARDLGAALEEYSRNKLLISPVLSRRLDEFFSKMLSAGVDLNLAMHPMTADGEQRDFSKHARKTAYEELPSILDAIRTEARALIHDQPQRS